MTSMKHCSCTRQPLRGKEVLVIIICIVVSTNMSVCRDEANALHEADASKHLVQCCVVFGRFLIE